MGGRSANGGDEDGGGVVSGGDGGGGIGGVERGGREGNDSDCGGEEGGCATVVARASAARAAVTMVAGSQEEGSGMAEIVTTVSGVGRRGRRQGRWRWGVWQVERSIGISDGEGMEEVRERDRQKWRCGLLLRS